MFGSHPLYDFGLSQDDAKTELNVLRPAAGDRILCIASAGEVPLELLVNSPADVQIDAVDISEAQLALTRLKWVAARLLTTGEAAALLGLQPIGGVDRKSLYLKIREELSEVDQQFWESHPEVLTHGPINVGRYEMYIAKFAPLGRWLLGGSTKLLGLFETQSISEQQEYFDLQLRSGLLQRLFRIMFHPKLYRNRGVAEQGLQHATDPNLGIRFYRLFRDFCTQTPARTNGMLQFVLFNRILFPKAYPDYLQPQHREVLLEGQRRLRLYHLDITDRIRTVPKGFYNKYALSNVSDWMTQNEFSSLLQLIAKQARRPYRGLSRYIHSPGFVESELPPGMKMDANWGNSLLKEDRFPFYRLIPFYSDD
jgi:S-adenosylmethionine-diacylglycerol 3-amino-3-carboxypropyl transferase